MKGRWIIVAMMVAIALLLFASCSLSANRATDQSLRGRMLLWHALPRSEADALNQVVNSFAELNPNVSVKVQVFSDSVELQDDFINAATNGLGPDLILAPSSWVPPLAGSQLIVPIDEY